MGAFALARIAQGEISINPREALNRFMYRTLGTMSCPYHDEVFERQMGIFHSSTAQSVPLSHDLATAIMEEYVDSFCLMHFGRVSGQDLSACRDDIKAKYRPLIVTGPNRGIPVSSPFAHVAVQSGEEACDIPREDALSPNSISSTPMIRARNLDQDNRIAVAAAQDLTGGMTKLAKPAEYCPPETPPKRRGILSRMKDWFKGLGRRRQPSHSGGSPLAPSSGTRSGITAANNAVSASAGSAQSAGSTPLGRKIAAAAIANTPSYRLRAPNGEPARYKQDGYPAGAALCLRGVRVATAMVDQELSDAALRPKRVVNGKTKAWAIDAQYTLRRAGFKEVTNSGNPLQDAVGMIHIYDDGAGGPGHIDISAVASDGTKVLVSDFQSRFAPGMRLVKTFAPPDYRPNHNPKPHYNIQDIADHSSSQTDGNI